jgi:hypothetical protein
MHLDPSLIGDDIKILAISIFMILYIFIVKRFKFKMNLTPWLKREVCTIKLPLEANRCKEHLNKSLIQENYSFWEYLLGKTNLEIQWNPQDDRHFIISEKWGGIGRGSEIEGHIKNHQNGNTLIEVRFGPGLGAQIFAYILAFANVFILTLDGQLLFGILGLYVTRPHLTYIFIEGPKHMQKRYREILPIIYSVK